MKKRFISFVLVLTIIFTGAFSCIASAESDTIRRYYDLYKNYFQGLFGLSGELVWDQSFFGDIDDLIDFIGEQKKAISQDDNVGLPQIYVSWPYSKWYAVDLSALSSDFSDCSLFAILDNYSGNGTGDLSNIGKVFCAAVPREYASHVSFNFDGSRYRLIADAPILYYTYTLQLGLSGDAVYSRFYSGPYTSNSSGGQFYTNTIDVPSSTYGKRLIRNDFDRTKLIFHGFSAETPGNIVLTLTANRDIIEDVDGTYMIGFGILYDDGNDRMYCGDYIDFREVGSGSSWESSFDLKAFSEYAYRKRCPLTGYKAFIFAYQNGFVFDMEFPLELDPPGGIFDDIEDPPDWKDYEPEPSEDPTPPEFYSDVIFNFNTSNNNYQSFSWTTINNYNIGGSGGSGGGSSGGDSSSSVDDSSSGTDDPSGDSSSGSDPGGDGSFNDWFSDAVVTINNNFNNGLDTLNENIRIIKENTENYFTAVHDYIVSYLHDWFVYIADLLKKFKDDFNAWTFAFGDYLTDTFKVINRNIAVVGDNIVKAIKMQVVPDKDIVYDIASSHFPMVEQLNTVFTDHEVEQKDLIVSIPLFGSDGEFSASFVDQSLNSTSQLRSGGQLRGGGDSSEASSSTPINDVSGNSVTFNLSEIFTQYDLPRFRSVGSVFILAATFFSLINITLKIFGLSFK